MARSCLPLLLVFSVTAYGQGASPEINEQYREPDYARWQRSLETEGREVYEKRVAIVDAVAPRLGQVIADVGAGTGLFTRLFAARVGPQGRVYAVDIAKAFVEGNLQRLAPRACRTSSASFLRRATPASRKTRSISRSSATPTTTSRTRRRCSPRSAARCARAARWW